MAVLLPTLEDLRTKGKVSGRQILEAIIFNGRVEAERIRESGYWEQSPAENEKTAWHDSICALVAMAEDLLKSALEDEKAGKKPTTTFLKAAAAASGALVNEWQLRTSQQPAAPSEAIVEPVVGDEDAAA